MKLDDNLAVKVRGSSGWGERPADAVDQAAAAPAPVASGGGGGGSGHKARPEAKAVAFVIPRPDPMPAVTSPPVPMPPWIDMGEPTETLGFLPPVAVVPPVVEFLPVPPREVSPPPLPVPPVGAVADSPTPVAAAVAPLASAVPAWLDRIKAAPPNPADLARIEETRSSTLRELAAMQIPALVEHGPSIPVVTVTRAAAPAAPPFTSSPAFKVGILAVCLIVVWRIAS